MILHMMISALGFLQEYLPIFMFITLASLLFSGFPVAFILGGLALLYGLFGYFLEIFSFYDKISLRGFFLQQQQNLYNLSLRLTILSL